jgi:hypothetical protein
VIQWLLRAAAIDAVAPRLCSVNTMQARLKFSLATVALMPAYHVYESSLDGNFIRFTRIRLVLNQGAKAYLVCMIYPIKQR